MATRQYNRLCFYQKLAILWMFFSGAVSCMHVFSSSSEVEMNGPPDSQNSDARNYIMKSYFDKYENLHDSSFEDFMAHELSSGLCEVFPDKLNINVRLSVLELSLLGEGSHRHLSSSIRLQIEAESIAKLPDHFCEVIIIQRLPLGVFADPFELQHLHERKVFTNIAVFGDTDLELPSFRSNRSVVEVHMDAGSNNLSGWNNGLEINVQFPLHARYQPLDESGYSIVEIGEPDVLMSCSMEGKHDKQSCLYMSPHDSAKSRTGTVAWRIPSGKKAHAGFVSVVTFGTAFLSTLSIVLTSICCSGVNVSKNLKQS
ncbi:Phosphatidylinositol-glycan biosynthesis class X protein, putative [Theobroma cacao]|uniref:Phosphatidylinositol-glycan biosynthesis class X protein, putative n=1 Tax=Theobroma cacao TaxID=3641 RepID=A0A061GDT5_THECC|nr:Phosphatidylinositol-glycan biosynthesis class X protein, putative [Theobroma cacao]